MSASQWPTSSSSKGCSTRCAARGTAPRCRQLSLVLLHWARHLLAAALGALFPGGAPPLCSNGRTGKSYGREWSRPVGRFYSTLTRDQGAWPAGSDWVGAPAGRLSATTKQEAALATPAMAARPQRHRAFGVNVLPALRGGTGRPQNARLACIPLVGRAQAPGRRPDPVRSGRPGAQAPAYMYDKNRLPGAAGGRILSAYLARRTHVIKRLSLFGSAARRLAVLWPVHVVHSGSREQALAAAAGHEAAVFQSSTAKSPSCCRYAYVQRTTAAASMAAQSTAPHAPASGMPRLLACRTLPRHLFALCCSHSSPCARLLNVRHAGIPSFRHASALGPP